MESGVVFCLVAVLAWGLAVGLVSGLILMSSVAFFRNELDYGGIESREWSVTK